MVGQELPEVELSSYRYDPQATDPSVLFRLDRFGRLRQDQLTQTVTSTSSEQPFYDTVVEYSRGGSIDNTRDGVHPG